MKHLRDDVMTLGSVLDWIEEQQPQPQQISSSREKSEVESSSDYGFD